MRKKELIASEWMASEDDRGLTTLCATVAFGLVRIFWTTSSVSYCSGVLSVFRRLWTRRGLISQMSAMSCTTHYRHHFQITTNKLVCLRPYFHKHTVCIVNHRQ